MSIIIGADFVPTKSNEQYFSDGNGVELVGEELMSIMRGADYRLFNLEVPLADFESPIAKCGPTLSAPTKAINGYKSIGVDCVTIANNHIMDQGENGFRSTIQTLKENNIDYVGGGDNLAEAKKAKIIDLDGKKIGIYACAEHEFSIAGENTLGANPFDPLESLEHIVNLKAVCDYVIVLYHGGKEHYRYPSPNLQKTCRKMVDRGADLVICQHSHCVGCEEKYLNKTIVYGQGNFLFDYIDDDFWNTGLLIKVEKDFSVGYIPICKIGKSIRIADALECEKILSEFKERSEEIKNVGFVEKQYDRFAKSVRNGYLLSLLGINRRSFLYRSINRLTGGRISNWIVSSMRKSKKLLVIRNYLECEAHREVILRGISNK